MNINQQDQLTWERYAGIVGERYFQAKGKPLLSSNNNAGLTVTVEYKDHSGNNKQMIFEDGILVDVI